MIANQDVWIEFNNYIFNDALIEKVLNIDNKVPVTDRQAINIFEGEVQRKTNYDMDLLSEEVRMEELNLTDDQKIAFDLQSWKKFYMVVGRLFFLDAPAGPEKYLSFFRYFKYWT